MELAFITLDVFTSTRYRGNPLAVVTIPAGANPSQAQKQAIAREFNLSETVFVHDVAVGGSGDHDDVNTARRVDIFVTDAELPFAGHPIIGLAVSLLDKHVDTLISKAGPIAVTETEPGVVRAEIPHKVHLHQKRLRHLHPDAGSQQQLSPRHEAIRQAELDAPVFSIVKGMAFLLVELPTLELLAKVDKSTASLPVDDLLDDGWQEGFLGKYYYVHTGTDEEAAPDETRRSIRSRMMEVAFEDPATGSAACALSSCLSLTQQLQRPGDSVVRYDITQGVEMGRESNIVVEVAIKDSQVHSVSLAGTATPVMRGYVVV